MARFMIFYVNGLTNGFLDMEANSETNALAIFQLRKPTATVTRIKQV